MKISRSIIASGLLISAAIILFAGVGTAQTAAAAKEFNRLVNLDKALGKIPMSGLDKEPHRSFLKRNDKDIVYSEPAGEWYVRSDRFWDLQKKYSKLAIADQIAWTAAENPMPGECEGYVNCYLFKIRTTYGEYLTLYPKGTYSRKAVQKTIEYLKYMAEDAVSGKKTYDGPTESSDKAEFATVIGELRNILSKVSHPEKTKALSQLKAIETAFK